MLCLRICLLVLLSVSIDSCKITKSNAGNPASVDIEKIAPSLIGKTVNKGIALLRLDSTQYYYFQEPPLIARGINITLSDTCSIRLYIERTALWNKKGKFERNTNLRNLVLHKRIIGVSWRKPKSKKHKTYGRVIPYYEW